MKNKKALRETKENQWKNDNKRLALNLLWDAKTQMLNLAISSMHDASIIAY